MQSFSNVKFKWLRQLSVKHKFYVILLLIIVVLLVELGNFWLSMKIMSGIRDYIGGEAEYSKAQIAAHGNILKYAISHDEADYQKFLAAISVPHKYNQVRLELEKDYPNNDFIRRTWLEVGIHPSDINDSFFLYRYFKNISYMKRPLELWAQADKEILEFMGLGRQIHDIISAPADLGSQEQSSAKDAQLALLMEEFEALDEKIQIQEKEFSASLSEGYRAVRSVLLAVTAVLTLTLGIFVISIAVLITKMIVQVDRDRGDFIRVANHQLNTPLSIMRNTYAMVEDGSLSLERGFEYLGSGLKRLVSVFEDIKTVLQFEGETQYDIQKTDLAAAVQEATEYGKKTIAINKKDIVISIKNPAFTPPMVWCDIKQINNAIHNILDNAVYYTPQGSITIFYELVDNKFLKVNIKDTGIGFAEEDRARLGQRFYRSKRALLARPDGSGLGLYICRNILENNKGKLLFESPGEGQGSTFGFILPIAR